MKSLTLLLVLVCLAVAAPAFAGVIYTDGPTTGTNLALFIDGPNPGGPFIESISDGFVASASGTASSLDFGMWVPTNSTPTAVSWWLGTTAFGGDISSGSTAQVSYTYLLASGYGYDVYEATVTGLSGSLTAGSSYWLTLGNGNNSFGNQNAAWDISNGPATLHVHKQWLAAAHAHISGKPSPSIGTSSPTPEPGSMMMFGTGILALAGVLRRKISL